jgi:hypothetical protein
MGSEVQQQPHGARLELDETPVAGDFIHIWVGFPCPNSQAG